MTYLSDFVLKPANADKLNFRSQVNNVPFGVAGNAIGTHAVPLIARM